MGAAHGRYGPETIWPALLDLSPWAGQQDFTAFIDAAFDRNGDDSVCMKTMWGDELNSNSHWYQVGFEILGSPAQMFIVRDNNANGG